jgi:hypothetical protein
MLAFRILAVVAAMSMVHCAASPRAQKAGGGQEHAAEQSKDKEMPGPAFVGKQLRAAIDRSYEERRAAHKTRGPGIEITDVVAKYISSGMSFTDAEAILREAGFTVLPQRINRNLPEKNPLRYAVTATIDQYLPSYVCRTSADVELYPRSPDDYSAVQNISAWIAWTCP